MTRKKKERAFRLRPKPIKPKREKGLQYKRNAVDSSIADILGTLDHYGVDPENATIEKDYDGDVDLVFLYTEAEDSFQKRSGFYERRLAVWEAWYNENEAAILAEIARREAFTREKNQRDTEKAKRRAAREIARLEKQLARMKKESVDSIPQ